MKTFRRPVKHYILIGTVRRPSDIPAGGMFPVDQWINLENTDLATGVRAATDGRGAEVVFDVVGGPIFEYWFHENFLPLHPDFVINVRRVGIRFGTTI